MTAHYLTIESKHRQMAGYLASLADFSLTPGDAVSPDIVIDRPDISLYCLDDAGKQAIFVELPPDVDLATAPFVYQTQYEQAQRLIAMPYATFQLVARRLPPVRHLVMLYMTGRCGSTLLSHVFNTAEGVLSLSEPDVATQFVHLRRVDGSRDAELHALLDSTVRMLFKPSASQSPSSYALKLRGEGTQLMDLFQGAFPEAKNLFLYRDAVGWVASFYRIFRRAGPLEPVKLDEFVAGFSELLGYDFRHLASYFDEGTTEVSTVQQLTLWWLAAMEWYLAQHNRGIPVLAVRYGDLNMHRERVVDEVFRYCGLPPTHADEALGVFARDAQAGTWLARDNPEQGNTLSLDEQQRDELIRILKRHPVISDPQFVAPGTLGV